MNIITYQEQYKKDFERLNREWIEQFFEIEELDKQLFANPNKEIIAKGGQIFFAINTNNIIVGTAAIYKINNQLYELGKMAVTAKTQSKGVGTKLITAAIAFVKNVGGKEIELYTNSALKPAIHLYQKMGFKHEDMSNNHFERADVKMILTI